MQKTHWPHAPTHQLAEGGAFMVTAGTYHKAHYFRGAQRLGVLHRGLLSVAKDFGWQLGAWAVFSNHYHFIGQPPADADANGLSQMLGVLHTKTARWINRLDATPERQVWFNFWETQLTFPRSFLARLNYVHQNPVKHGLVPVANQYPWCSARWFEREGTAAMVKSVYGFKTDGVKTVDEFEVWAEW